MKKFILGIVLFVIGVIGILFMLYGSLEYPHVYSTASESYRGLTGFLKGNGFVFLFYVFVIFAVSGLSTSILTAYTKILN